jgi:MFS family permease
MMIRSIRWHQVWSLAILLVAVMFCWMVYGFYQPKILESLGMMAIATQLNLIQGILGAIVEPLVGWKSDQIFRKLGDRFPLITVGVTLAGLIFVITAGLVQNSVIDSVRWIIPLLMTVWVIAMIIFRGPAIAILRQFAPVDVPHANAILTFVFGLTGAIAPLIQIIIQHLGISTTFLLAAVALVVGAVGFKFSRPKPLSLSPTLPDIRRSISRSQVVSIFWVGLAAGIQSTLLLNYCPQILHLQNSSISSVYYASAILLVSAFSALPLEQLAFRWGIHRAMQISLVSISGLLGALFFFPSPLIIVMFGLGFGLLFISQIPFALGSVPMHQAGLGTGLYFGGIGGGSAVVTTLLSGQPSFGVLWTGSVLASAVAILAVRNTRYFG